MKGIPNYVAKQIKAGRRFISSLDNPRRRGGEFVVWEIANGTLRRNGKAVYHIAIEQDGTVNMWTEAQAKRWAKEDAILFA